MRPICMKCHRFFKLKKTGIYFTEGMPVGNVRPEPGLSESSQWKPYKLWSGDKYQCDGCGAEVIHGVGREPISIQHQKDFREQVESFCADFQVNDC